MNRFSPITAAAAAIILSTSAISMSAAQAQTHAIGAVAQGSLAYATAAAIAKVGSEDAGIKLRVIPQGGPVVTIPLVSSGELSFSVGISVVTAYAHKGAAMFKKRPQKNALVVAALFPLRIGFFVRKDSDIKTIADFKGKRVGSGYQKQRIIGVFTKALLAMHGLSMKDVVGVPAVNFAKNIQDFNAGRADTAMAALGSGLVSQSNAAVGGIRWVSIENTPKNLAMINKFTPGTFIDTVKPAKPYVGILKPTNMVTAPYVLLGGAHVSNDVVYKLAKAMHAGKKKLVGTLKAYNGFHPKNMGRDMGLKFHPGAVKFYKEAGIWPGK